MDTDYPIDLPAVFAVIDSAEMITCPFLAIPQRFLFDDNAITGAGYHTLWERPPACPAREAG